MRRALLHCVVLTAVEVVTETEVIGDLTTVEAITVSFHASKLKLFRGWIRSPSLVRHTSRWCTDFQQCCTLASCWGSDLIDVNAHVLRFYVWVDGKLDMYTNVIGQVLHFAIS